MKQIPLTQGKFAIVDDDKYELLSQYTWYTKKGKYTYYAMMAVWEGSKKTTILMHRFIMKPKLYQQIDHINGNGWDNRIKNLRYCSNSQNAQNSRKMSSVCSSKYKGVHYFKRQSSWQASIRIDYKKIHLGYYKNEIDAAKVYDTKAKELFGVFANTNF